MFRKPKMTSKFYAWEELQFELANNNTQTLTGGSIFYDEACGISQLESEDITTNPSTSENLEPRQLNSAFTEFKPWLSKVMCECTTKCTDCMQDIEDLCNNKKESGPKKRRKISKALTKAFRRNRPQQK